VASAFAGPLATMAHGCSTGSSGSVSAASSRSISSSSSSSSSSDSSRSGGNTNGNSCNVEKRIKLQVDSLLSLLTEHRTTSSGCQNCFCIMG